jgi:hypothetical protein
VTVEIKSNIQFEIETDEIVDAVLEADGFGNAIEQAVEHAMERQEAPDFSDEIEREVDRVINRYDPAEVLMHNKEFMTAVAKQVIQLLTANITLGVEGEET